MATRTKGRTTRAAQRRHEREARQRLADALAAKLDRAGWTRTLAIDDMAALLGVSEDVIRRRIKDGTFPIPPHGIAQQYGWWGPSVKAWLESQQSLDAWLTSQKSQGVQPTAGDGK